MRMQCVAQSLPLCCAKPESLEESSLGASGGMAACEEILGQFPLLDDSKMRAR
jgi:hypothetical protein